MPLTVNTNIASINAQRNVGISNAALSTSLERLSSGLRINKAADDAAGLAIATKFDAQVKGLNQAARNANNAVSLVQTAEGGVNTMTDILQRLRELAVQASSDDSTPSDRTATSAEASNLIAEFTRVASTSEFNTMPLLDGTFGGKYFQVGANYSQNLTFTINDVRGRSVGGRAEYSANIGDGVTAATNANLGVGEIKINGSDVAPTNSADDQYSVLDMSSGALTGIAADALSANASINFTINGTTVNVNFSASAAITNDQIAASIAAQINAAGITNVTARTVNGSAWVLEATGGTNLNLQFSYATAATTSAAFSIGGTAVGMNALSAMFGNSTAGTVGNYNGESSAIAKAVAINAIKGTTAVMASAKGNVVTGNSAIQAVNLSSGDVYINGKDIGAVTVLANDSTGALATAINNQQANTGVTASVDQNGKLLLTAADGRNIAVTTRNAAIGASLGLSGTATNTTWLYRSQIQLNDKDNFTITSASSLADLTGAAGTSLSVASDVSKYNVAGIKFDTSANAQAAILTVDAALDNVNAVRAQIGAVQNRLEFTVNNLNIASENMTAAESRIKDADFASEVANFTRNQIMVQAGVAMVAQANTSTQVVLQLLK